MSNNVADRLAALMTQLDAQQALLLTNPTDVSYFSDFAYLVPEEREGFLVVTPQQAYLLHASFSPTPQHQALQCLAGVSPHQLPTHIRKIRSEHHFDELLIDKTRLFAEEYEALMQIKDLTLGSLDRSLVWNQRMYKDESELAAISAASKIAAQSLAATKNQLKAGMTEIEFQQLLEAEMTKNGSQKPAFPTIVAFGPHSALPHHQPTSSKLTQETAVLIDFGATVSGYRSDMTVSFWFGNQPPAEFVKIEKIANEAYEAGLKLLIELPRDELTASAVDQAVRDHITQASYGPHFIHTTGHGLGLDIHEQPSIHWHNQVQLEAGMVITIEPGIYLEGSFGYRHEHTVLVTETGYQELTKL